LSSCRTRTGDGVVEIRILGRLGTPKQQAVLGSLRPTTATPSRSTSWSTSCGRTARRRQRAHVRGEPPPPAHSAAGWLPPRRDGRRAGPGRVRGAPHGGWAAFTAGDLTGTAEHLERAYALRRGSVLAGLTHGTRTAARCQAVDDDQAAWVERLAEVRLMLGEPAATRATRPRRWRPTRPPA
jgi:hypothetical protein